MVAAALTGLLPESARCAGQILINGDPVDGRPQWRRLRGRTVGFVPQEGSRHSTPRRLWALSYASWNSRHRQWSSTARAPRPAIPPSCSICSRTSTPAARSSRAALAAALLPSPAVLIADEPVTLLDIETAYAVWTTLRRYADAGAAILVIHTT